MTRRARLIRSLASGSAKTVRLWDARTGKRTLKGHVYSVVYWQAAELEFVYGMPITGEHKQTFRRHW